MKYIVDSSKMLAAFSDKTDSRWNALRILAEKMNDGSFKAEWAKPVEKSSGKKALYSDMFEEFWKIYPARRGSKSGKMPAYKAWCRVGISEENLLSLCVEALNKQARTEQWTKDGGAFIPMASTYLNQRRWEDEIGDEPTSSCGIMSQFGL